MAVVLADHTEPGSYYRRTMVSNTAGTYYMRPKHTKRMNPRAWVNKLVEKGDPLGTYWAHTLKANPDFVLRCRYHRGISSFTLERWEVKRYILVPPDMRFRQVKTRPGYKR